MDKTPEKVTKDPKRVEAARKSREKYMNKLKQKILNDAKKSSRDTTDASNETTNGSNETSSPTNNASNETTTPATSTTTRSSDTYVLGVGILAVLAIGVCVFLHITLFLKNKSMKKRINHQNDVIYFKKKSL